MVYLTFDDGPSIYTPAILRILSHFHSTATFFEMGNHVAEFPQLTAAVRAQGSVVGNHTYDHPDLTKLKPREVRAEFRGGPPSRCARPPYGATNKTVRHVIAKLGMRQVLWSVDTVDWSRPGAQLIYLRGAGFAVYNGSIVLMHDGGGIRSQTVAALPKIIAELQRRGYLIRKLPYC